MFRKVDGKDVFALPELSAPLETSRQHVLEELLLELDSPSIWKDSRY